jgi:hypothetical protein
MKSDRPSSNINRRVLISGMALLPALSGMPITAIAQAQTTQDGPLGSWNEGPAKQAIFDFVRATTDQGSPNFVPPEERIATFDQDGTLWAEHPIYSQVVYCLDRVRSGGEGSETQERRAVQNSPLGQPRGNRQALTT